MHKGLFLWSVVFVAFFGSCKKQKDLRPTPQNEEDYYPLEEGAYRIYDVEERTYTLLGQTTSVYQLKEVLKEPWTDLEGKKSFKIYRYKRPDNTSEFTLDSLWNVKKVENGSVVVTENNVPFLKLDLPLSDAKTWNGNRYNSYAEQKYKVENQSQSWAGFSNTVSIVQQSERKLLFDRYKVEVFAKEIGLVYKEETNVNFDDKNTNLRTIVDGTIYKQSLLSHGKE